MESQMFSVGVIDVMNGEWTYCCRCDRAEAMAPQGPGKWGCVYCGLRIVGERIERDVFSCDTDLTQEEVQRHITYLTNVAKRKADKIMNPPPLSRRARFIFWIARILRVKLIKYHNFIGGKDVS